MASAAAAPLRCPPCGRAARLGSGVGCVSWAARQDPTPGQGDPLVAGLWRHRPEQALQGGTCPLSSSTPLPGKLAVGPVLRRSCPLHSGHMSFLGLQADGWTDRCAQWDGCRRHVRGVCRCEVCGGDQHPCLGPRPPSALPPLTSHGWGHSPGTGGSSEGLRPPGTCPGHLATYAWLGKGVSGGPRAAAAHRVGRPERRWTGAPCPSPERPSQAWRRCRRDRRGAGAGPRASGPRGSFRAFSRPLTWAAALACPSPP